MIPVTDAMIQPIAEEDSIMIAQADVTAEVCIVALVVFREASGESDLGKAAVAWTMRNRVQHPKWWGNDYWSVATKRWQYSSISAPGDPNLIKWPAWTDQAFQRCLDIAGKVLRGEIPHPLPGADSYYADWITFPDWATADKLVGKIGRHVFFNVDSDNGD